jgi:hypothetical protein
MRGQTVVVSFHLEVTLKYKALFLQSEQTDLLALECHHRLQEEARYCA